MSKTAESNAEATKIVTRSPPNARRVAFSELREDRDRWERALKSTYHIERGGRPDLFLVRETSAPMPENCSLSRRGDTFLGWCSCDSFEPGLGSDPDDPYGICHHLVALRQRAVLDSYSIPRSIGTVPDG